MKILCFMLAIIWQCFQELIPWKDGQDSLSDLSGLGSEDRIQFANKEKQELMKVGWKVDKSSADFHIQCLPHLLVGCVSWILYLRNYLFLKNYVTSQGAVSHKVLYSI